MKPRDRVLNALNHKNVDRIPISLGFGINEPVLADLKTYLSLGSKKEVEEYLIQYSDIRIVAPEYIGPDDLNTTDMDGKSIDIWNVKRKPVSYGLGSYDEIYCHPLAKIESVDDLDSCEFPSVEWFDLDTIQEQIDRVNKDDEYAIQIGIANIFETSWYMRGYEQMFIDLIVNPDLAWAIMKRVTDYFIEYYEKILQRYKGQIDLVFTADDIGQQQTLLMSINLWEEMIRPHHIRLNNMLHQYGVKIMYHSDGSIYDAIPGLIEMGIDVLDPLQFDAKNMDPARIKKEYGDYLSFHGGVSVQKTLPFGTVEDVISEVRERIHIMGQNGGYIIAPSHAIQAGTPPENVMAFLETAKQMNS